MNAMKSQGMDAKSPKASKIQDGLPKPKFLLELMSFIFCVTTPMTVLFYCIAYQDFDTALSATAKSAYSEGFLHFFLKRTPLPTFEATRGYAAWLSFQGLLYIALPGPTVFGPPTPAGRRLRYKLNGLAAWIVTVCLAVSGSFAGILSPTALAKTWRELVAVTNIFSFIILLLFQIKARVAPDNAYETYITGKPNLPPRFLSTLHVRANDRSQDHFGMIYSKEANFTHVLASTGTGDISFLLVPGASSHGH